MTRAVDEVVPELRRRNAEAALRGYLGHAGEGYLDAFLRELRGELLARSHDERTREVLEEVVAPMRPVR